MSTENKEPARERKQKVYNRATADHFIRLVDTVGHAEATKLLDVQPGTTSRWYVDRRIAYAYEELSRRILMDMDTKVGPPTMLAVKVRQDKLELVKTFLKGAECQFMEWKL